jgi:hypothetical protein
MLKYFFAKDGVAVIVGLLAVAFGLWALIFAAVIGAIVLAGGHFIGGYSTAGYFLLAAAALLALGFRAYKAL